MPPPKTRAQRKHPRSLDALFGPAKPKVRPTKRCPHGHIQTQRYRPGDACLECASIARRAARDAAAKAERAAYSAAHPAPAVLRIKTLDTGRVTTYSIPPALAAQKKRDELKRRGRRRPARI